MPRVSEDRLLARRRQILDGARRCFARHGYEGATVRLLEESTGLSRGAIFHHFRDKEALFVAVADDDAVRMVSVVEQGGLIQALRDLLAEAEPGWLGTQLEVTRKMRTDPQFAARWAQHTEAVEAATRARLERQREAGVLRTDVPLTTLHRLLTLVHDGLVARLAMGQDAGDLGAVLDLVEESVRQR